MQIVDIFAISETQALWSVQWDAYSTDEVTRVFDLFTDAEVLFKFFTAHQKDLFSGFHQDITTEEAVFRTRKEALSLKKELLQLDQYGKTNYHEKLSSLFKPLSGREFNRSGFTRHKAYGYLQKSMIRLYAIELKPETFLVTGGAIKLTRKMQERKHTRDELQNLNWAIEYLKDQGIYL